VTNAHDKSNRNSMKVNVKLISYKVTETANNEWTLNS